MSSWHRSKQQRGASPPPRCALWLTLLVLGLLLSEVAPDARVCVAAADGAGAFAAPGVEFYVAPVAVIGSLATGPASLATPLQFAILKNNLGCSSTGAAAAVPIELPSPRNSTTSVALTLTPSHLTASAPATPTPNASDRGNATSSPVVLFVPSRSAAVLLLPFVATAIGSVPWGGAAVLTAIAAIHAALVFTLVAFRRSCFSRVDIDRAVAALVDGEDEDEELNAPGGARPRLLGDAARPAPPSSNRTVAPRGGGTEQATPWLLAASREGQWQMQREEIAAAALTHAQEGRAAAVAAARAVRFPSLPIRLLRALLLGVVAHGVAAAQVDPPGRFAVLFFATVYAALLPVIHVVLERACFAGFWFAAVSVDEAIEQDAETTTLVDRAGAAAPGAAPGERRGLTPPPATTPPEGESIAAQQGGGASARVGLAQRTDTDRTAAGGGTTLPPMAVEAAAGRNGGALAPLRPTDGTGGAANGGRLPPNPFGGDRERRPDEDTGRRVSAIIAASGGLPAAPRTAGVAPRQASAVAANPAPAALFAAREGGGDERQTAGTSGRNHEPIPTSVVEIYVRALPSEPPDLKERVLAVLRRPRARAIAGWIRHELERRVGSVLRVPVMLWPRGAWRPPITYELFGELFVDIGPMHREANENRATDKAKGNPQRSATRPHHHHHQREAATVAHGRGDIADASAPDGPTARPASRVVTIAWFVALPLLEGLSAGAAGAADPLSSPCASWCEAAAVLQSACAVLWLVQSRFASRNAFLSRVVAMQHVLCAVVAAASASDSPSNYAVGTAATYAVLLGTVATTALCIVDAAVAPRLELAQRIVLQGGRSRQQKADREALEAVLAAARLTALDSAAARQQLRSSAVVAPVAPDVHGDSSVPPSAAPVAAPDAVATAQDPPPSLPNRDAAAYPPDGAAATAPHAAAAVAFDRVAIMAVPPVEDEATTGRPPPGETQVAPSVDDEPPRPAAEPSVSSPRAWRGDGPARHPLPSLDYYETAPAPSPPLQQRRAVVERVLSYARRGGGTTGRSADGTLFGPLSVLRAAPPPHMTHHQHREGPFLLLPAAIANDGPAPLPEASFAQEGDIDGDGETLNRPVWVEGDDFGGGRPHHHEAMSAPQPPRYDGWTPATGPFAAASPAGLQRIAPAASGTSADGSPLGRLGDPFARGSGRRDRPDGDGSSDDDRLWRPPSSVRPHLPVWPSRHDGGGRSLASLPFDPATPPPSWSRNANSAGPPARPPWVLFEAPPLQHRGDAARDDESGYFLL